MNISLGFSTCPNDTFMFDAMVHHKIDTEGLYFSVFMGDIETLNSKALQGDLDVTKLSYGVFPYVADNYLLLNSGSALGSNCGPLLIAKKMLSDEELMNKIIAIPGRYTTANLLLGITYPNLLLKEEFLFSEIENTILRNSVGAGVIIHENRFTYADKGLVKICDLGELWEKETNLPIPLGGIAVRKAIPKEVQLQVNRVLSKSVRYAMDHHESAKDYIRTHAKEMDETVMYNHIALYVNEFSISLGDIGRMAVAELFRRAGDRNLIPEVISGIFIR